MIRMKKIIPPPGKNLKGAKSLKKENQIKHKHFIEFGMIFYVICLFVIILYTWVHNQKKNHHHNLKHIDIEGTRMRSKNIIHAVKPNWPLSLVDGALH